MSSINNLPPIPQDPIEENIRWREWFRNLGTFITKAQMSQSTWAVSQGGTGAGDATTARTNLGIATVGHTGFYTDLLGTPTGYSGTVTTAKLTGGGTNGSMTFVNGILTAQTQAT
jgi:hypothetical protein